MLRVIESMEQFSKGSTSSPLDIFTNIICDKDCEFGYFTKNITKDRYGEYLLPFTLNKEYSRIATWSKSRITDRYLANNTNIPYGFVELIKINNNIVTLSVNFNIMLGRNPIVILNTSDVFKNAKDETIVIKGDILPRILKLYDPLFRWLKMSKTIFKFFEIVEMLPDIFSDTFDECGDYLISPIRLGSNRSGEIFGDVHVALSTGKPHNVNKRGYVDMDVSSKILRELLNVVVHLEDSDVTISYNTTIPDKSVFEPNETSEKNATFYSSQAIIVYIKSGKTTSA